MTVPSTMKMVSSQILVERPARRPRLPETRMRWSERSRVVSPNARLPERARSVRPARVGTSDFDGNVHIKNTLDTGAMPSTGDDNYPDGAKIRLGLSNDVDCIMRSMIGWNPIEYLFEYDLITFEDIDGRDKHRTPA